MKDCLTDTRVLYQVLVRGDAKDGLINMLDLTNFAPFTLRHPDWNASGMMRHHSPGWCCERPSGAAKSFTQQGWRLHHSECTAVIGRSPLDMPSFTAVCLLCELIEGYMICMFVIETTSICVNVLPSLKKDQHHVLLVPARHYASHDVEYETGGVSWRW